MPLAFSFAHIYKRNGFYWGDEKVFSDGIRRSFHMKKYPKTPISYNDIRKKYIQKEGKKQ